jgi:D-arabinose 5-phosphate isomerase GutQ
MQRMKKKCHNSGLPENVNRVINKMLKHVDDVVVVGIGQTEFSYNSSR